MNLVTESEILEKQNTDLKDLERKLEKERRELLEALQQHSTICVAPGGYQAPTLTTRHNGCCSALGSETKTATSSTSSGRGRRSNGTRGRAGGRGGGGGGRGCRKSTTATNTTTTTATTVKQEPIRSPLQPDKSVLPNIMSTVQLPHFPTTQNNSNNATTTHSTSTSLSNGLVDPFYPKYSAMDESPSLDYYNYDGTLTSIDAVTNCANYLLKSPTTSVDSMTTAALNDLSNSSNFSYPLAMPVNIGNGGSVAVNGMNLNGGGGGGGNGMLLRQQSPLIKNDFYIPNECENSNDLMNPMVQSLQQSELYSDMDTETKLHEMTLNGNNMSCYDDPPLFSVLC